MPTAADVRAAALAGSGPRRTEVPPDATSEPFFVLVDDVPDEIGLRVDLDTRYVAPADAEAYVRELAAVVVAAALDPAAAPAVPGPVRPAG